MGQEGQVSDPASLGAGFLFRESVVCLLSWAGPCKTALFKLGSEVSVELGGAKSSRSKGAKLPVGLKRTGASAFFSSPRWAPLPTWPLRSTVMLDQGPQPGQH